MRSFVFWPSSRLSRQTSYYPASLTRGPFIPLFGARLFQDPRDYDSSNNVASTEPVSGGANLVRADGGEFVFPPGQRRVSRVRGSPGSPDSSALGRRAFGAADRGDSARPSGQSQRPDSPNDRQTRRDAAAAEEHRQTKRMRCANKYYKKSALFVLRAVAKHSPEMANVVVHGGGLEVMVVCLEDFDSGVKEAAAWALGYVARHNGRLAQATVDAGAVPLLVLCLQEPELCLKQISASALCDIGKHSVELAQTLVDAGAVPFLARAIANPDAKLKRQVFSALASIARHSIELAEMVVEAEIFPEVLVHMGHPDESVSRAAATLTREVCKHTLELAQLVVNTGGIGALIELIGSSKSATRLPAIMALGYIAGHSDQLAIAVIGSRGVTQLAIVLQEETEDHILAITAWALGQIGKHTPEHARAVAAANLFPKLLEMHGNDASSEDLRAKSRAALKQVLQKCLHIEALEPLLQDAPANILKYVLGQFSKILPNDPRSRRLFVTSGGLKKVQEIQAEPDSTLAEYIKIINCCFPAEIVRYYSPGYPDTLLESVEQYQPKCLSENGSEGRLSSKASNSSVSLVQSERV